MRTRKTRILMGALAVTAGLLALCACNNVPQPKPGCTIGQGNFAAKYTLKQGEDPSTACAKNKGEIIGLRDYSDENGGYFIAIRSTLLGTADPAKRTDPNPDDQPYSFGAYPLKSNDQSFCVAPTLSPARVRLPASGSAAAVDRTYEWSDVEILVTPRASGTQFKASLKYTDATVPCSANYDVVAMWPGINCGVKGQPDNTKCATKADPANNIRVGCDASNNCLSPDIKTKCDPDLLLCVLDGTPPVQSDQ